MVVTVLARPTIGTCRPSCRAPGDPHSNGPTSHRLDANSRGPFGAIVSADQAAAWLRLPSQTPPKEGCVETTPTPSVQSRGRLRHIGVPITTTQLHMPRSQRHKSRYQQGDTQNTADAAYPADALGRRTYRNGCNAEPTSASNSAVPRLIRNPRSLPNKIIIRARIDNR